jgi:hypothetical protein
VGYASVMRGSSGGVQDVKNKTKTYVAGLETRASSTDLLVALSSSRGTVEAWRTTGTFTIAITNWGTRSSGLGLLEGCWHDVIWKVQVSK